MLEFTDWINSKLGLIASQVSIAFFNALIGICLSGIESLDIKISREQSQYDEYYKQYEYYEGKTLSPDDYQKAQRALDKINSQAEKVNAMIDQQHQLIEQINEMINELGCKPNFEMKS